MVVATQVGEATFGRFSMAHTLGCMIEVLAINMAVSLTVEGSFDRSQLAANCRHALRRALLIIVPIVVVVIVGAPFILQVFGSKFADEGTMLLRLMALAVLPRVLIEVYLSVLRAQSRAHTLATGPDRAGDAGAGLYSGAFPVHGRERGGIRNADQPDRGRTFDLRKTT